MIPRRRRVLVVVLKQRMVREARVVGVTWSGWRLRHRHSLRLLQQRVHLLLLLLLLSRHDDDGCPIHRLLWRNLDDGGDELVGDVNFDVALSLEVGVRLGEAHQNRNDLVRQRRRGVGGDCRRVESRRRREDGALVTLHVAVHSETRADAEDCADVVAHLVVQRVQPVRVSHGGPRRHAVGVPRDERAVRQFVRRGLCVDGHSKAKRLHFRRRRRPRFFVHARAERLDLPVRRQRTQHQPHRHVALHVRRHLGRQRRFL
mmetsp:Transcript_19548/g.60402  ORF Transcript_19548/g.60402 Transcript_19548/m.60402 type:complete len:259 (+) Transcript_19548:1743-2519(+)